MKIQRLISVLAIACVSGSVIPLVTSQTNVALSQSAIAQAAPESQGRLTPVQIQKLNLLGLRIAAPTYVPTGFWVSSVEIKPGRAPGRPGYTISYRDPDNACFAINSGRGGLGGPSLEGYQTLPINSALLGRGTMYYARSVNSSKDAPPALFSLPIEARDGRWYAFQGAGSREMSGCKNISPQEAVRVIESLQYLNP